MEGALNGSTHRPNEESDMQFSYPESTAGDDDPPKLGHPDKDFLNRKEWYEVLYFCNRTSKESKGIALKSERLIRNHLPGNVRGQDNVLKWLQDNWDNFN